ncbi:MULTISPECIES: FtsW/RodA/SpoVE family cell cycle protein [Exiguobacterium]|uniref:Cell cycle protein n=1 Tax=Exiguobacterium sibiricum (strain DSM 17290 / CCUG 55495 / CIP 109462 / JCM 13490 / 255-15) TaxID=262543 RepID=B1YJB0_EXIS2|nr:MULTISPECIES: FtsW/RodA/SpoVE family cell cycle protein [Exiguobacterium]ACB61491.1 cell cycle protein [Exiguobacterium sibiricum 255-15]MCT4793123.1 rod shape-determining protein RodA [Exiguobacterium artemiae]MDX1258425.1 rod shape-determining protein RodA [Exiguobacterium sp. K1]
MNRFKSFTQRYDNTLLFLLGCLMVVSVIAIYTAQPFLQGAISEINFMAKQIQWYIIGFIALSVVILIDYEQLKRFHWYLYGAGIVSLIGLVVLRGTPLVANIKGAYGWYQFPVIGTVQPAEFMKFFLIVSLAAVISEHNARYVQHERDFLLLVKMVALTLLPLALIIIQPDLGIGLILCVILACAMLLSGLNWKWLLTMFGLLAVAIVGFFYLFYFQNDLLATFFPGHAMNRIMAWLQPFEYADDLSYQLVQSINAIGSGQMFGVGYGKLQVSVPELHTDFIFTAISAHYGFIGAAVVLIILFLFIYRLIQIALETADPFGTYIVTGYVAMFTFQIFQNIGMTMGVLPITGLPLPFISYGGSTMIVNLVGLGLIMAIASQSRISMFDED